MGIILPVHLGACGAGMNPQKRKQTRYDKTVIPGLLGFYESRSAISSRSDSACARFSDGIRERISDAR